jgi:hypothetical protein
MLVQDSIIHERNLARRYIDVAGSVMLIVDGDFNILYSAGHFENQAFF